MRAAAALLALSASACLEAPAPAADAGDRADDAAADGPVVVDAAPCLEQCCPIGQLREDFGDDGSIDEGRWMAEAVPADGTCVVVVEDGRLWLSNTNPEASCDYESTALYRLADEQTATVELAVPGDGVPNMTFGLELVPDEQVEFELLGGSIRVTNGSGIVLKEPVSFGDEHRFLRFRGDEAGDVLYLDTSPNAIDWEPFHAHTYLVPGSDECVEIELGTGGVTGNSPDDRVAFDNFNIVP